jgi:hypothetical protein
MPPSPPPKIGWQDLFQCKMATERGEGRIMAALLTGATRLGGDEIDKAVGQLCQWESIYMTSPEISN